MNKKFIHKRHKSFYLKSYQSPLFDWRPQKRHKEYLSQKSMTAVIHTFFPSIPLHAREGLGRTVLPEMYLLELSNVME